MVAKACCRINDEVVFETFDQDKDKDKGKGKGKGKGKDKIKNKEKDKCVPKLSK